MNRYDQFIEWISSYWIGAVVLLLLAALAALPSTKDGLAIILSAFKGTVSRFRRTTIKVGNEKAILTTMLQEETFDVVKVDADVHKVGIAAEYQWVKRRYRDCEVTGQAITTLDLLQGRKYGATQIHFDVISIKLKSGKTKDVYFDISSFFNWDPLSLLDPKGIIGLKIARLYKPAKKSDQET